MIYWVGVLEGSNFLYNLFYYFREEINKQKFLFLEDLKLLAFTIFKNMQECAYRQRYIMSQSVFKSLTIKLKLKLVFDSNSS
mmetsp:Transcript_43154/g.101186  ORF Transcript_43154/g.101186 Transcript_43154/m.101186 type:complete len:82 (+) Transcript_43154:2078-2323(+)